MRTDFMLIIAGMALITYLTRFLPLILFRFTGIPDWLEQWLKHVPVAILTALIIPTLVFPKGTIDLTLNNHYLLAGIAAAVTAYKTRNILPTMALGMLIMFTLRLF